MRNPDSRPIAARVVSLIVVLCASVQATAQTIPDDLVYPGTFEFEAIVDLHRLPTRMYLATDISDLVIPFEASQDDVEMLKRVAGAGYDEELTCDAVDALRKIIQHDVVENNQFRELLRSLIEDDSSPRIHRHAVMALLSVNDPEDAPLLAKQSRKSDPGLNRNIEDRLIAWKSDVLQQEWAQRVATPEKSSRSALVLACRGLQALKALSSAADLKTLASSSQQSFSVRMAAAEALTKLDIASAESLAAQVSLLTSNDRILATRLLQQTKSDAGFQILDTLAKDTHPVVATGAFEVLLKQAPEKLASLVEHGMAHPEARIRSTVIDHLKQFSSAENAARLHTLLADKHAGVRNDARQALAVVARENSELAAAINSQAGDSLSPDSSWQMLEQCCLLLGDLKTPDYQARCLPLLTHKQPEVLVAAGWLLHVMPARELNEPLEKHTRTVWNRLFNRRSEMADAAARRQELAAQAAARSREQGRAGRRNRQQNQQTPAAEKAPGGLTDKQFRAYCRQAVYLFHALGYTECAAARDLMEAALKKGSPVYEDTRAAGVYGLALLTRNAAKDGQAMAAATRLIKARLLDASEQLPESEWVRTTAALGLGIMGQQSSIADLKYASSEFGHEHPAIFNACNTALIQLGAEAIPVEPPTPYGLGPWPVGDAE